MQLGVALSRAHPRMHVAIALEAERQGFESVWMADHLVFPVDLHGSPHPGEAEPPVPPSTPVLDAFAWLCALAARTEHLRLGTNVYLLGLRHPFVAARAVQTLDVVSGGRAEVGVGAGWLREEWTAAGLDPATRGRRLDEALAVCDRLWREPVVEHRGGFFDFPPVMFEPKPVQRPRPRIHVGGESEAALRRAARWDGWYGLVHTPDSAAARVERLRALRREAGREDAPFQVTLSAGSVGADDVARFADVGVDRLVVAPWSRSSEAPQALASLAAALRTAGGAAAASLRIR